MSVINLARRIVCPVLARFEPPLMKSVSWGQDHPDKTFLVIRRHEPLAGLCSLVASSLAWIRFAEQNGMTPVVDLQTFHNIYQQKGERGKVNTWEFFFRQPSGYSLSDISRASRVIVATGIMPVRGFMPGFTNDLAAWRDVARRNLVPVEGNLAPYSCEAFESCDRKNIIGVLARGTDYAMLRPHSHPIQPTAEQLIAKLKAEGRSKDIFLVTEDLAIQQALLRQFGNRLMLSKQSCAQYESGYLANCKGVKNSRDRGLAYLKAIIDLSRCPSVIAGRTSGTLVAALLADDSQKAEYFDLGYYP